MVAKGDIWLRPGKPGIIIVTTDQTVLYASSSRAAAACRPGVGDRHVGAPEAQRFVTPLFTAAPSAPQAPKVQGKPAPYTILLIWLNSGHYLHLTN